MGPGGFLSLRVQEGDGVAGPWSLESNTSRFAAASGSKPLGNLLLLGFPCLIKQE